MKIEIFEKAINAEQREWELGKETEFYKKYQSYPEETKDKVRIARKKYGCPSVAVLRAYYNAKEWNTEKLLIDDFWTNDGTDVLATLEKGNVKEVYLTDSSSGLMGEIHVLAKGGWKMEALEIDHPYYTIYDSETKKHVPNRVKTLRFFK